MPPPSRVRPAPELVPASFVEALIETLIAQLSSAEVERARAAFEERTGAFSTGDAFHEERIRAFSDELVCAHRGADGLSAAERAVRALPPSDASETGRWLRALTRAERGLYRVDRGDDGPRLSCLLGGAVYRVRLDADPRDPAARLRDEDVFDGRIVPIDGEIRLLPGMIFHRDEAHDALAALLPVVLREGRPRGEILDGLARMRMRHDRFTSIHARHLYRADAIGTREIQTASWKGHRRTGP